MSSRDITAVWVDIAAKVILGLAGIIITFELSRQSNAVQKAFNLQYEASLKQEKSNSLDTRRDRLTSVFLEAAANIDTENTTDPHLVVARFAATELCKLGDRDFLDILNKIALTAIKNEVSEVEIDTGLFIVVGSYDLDQLRFAVQDSLEKRQIIKKRYPDYDIFVYQTAYSSHYAVAIRKAGGSSPSRDEAELLVSQLRYGNLAPDAFILENRNWKLVPHTSRVSDADPKAPEKKTDTNIDCPGSSDIQADISGSKLSELN